MDELNAKVEKLLFSEKTLGEVFKEMSELGYSKDEIFNAIKVFDKKYVNTNSRIFD